MTCRGRVSCAVLALSAAVGCAKAVPDAPGAVGPGQTAGRPDVDLGFAAGCWGQSDDDTIICFEPERSTWDTIYITAQTPILSARADGEDVLLRTRPGCIVLKATGETRPDGFAHDRPDRIVKVGERQITFAADVSKAFPLERIAANPPGDVCSEGARAERAGMRDRFWKFVEGSRPTSGACAGETTSAACCAARASLVADSLRSSSSEQIVELWSELTRALNRAYSHDVWGACFVVRGGCSDDAFHEFRLSLIASGRETFDAVLANPDGSGARLATVAENTCDPFSSGLSAAYEAKTSAPYPPANALPPSLDGQEPMGEPWEEADLAKRFDLLCKQFGPC